MRPPGSLPTLRGCAGPIAVRQTSRARAQVVHVAGPTVDGGAAAARDILKIHIMPDSRRHDGAVRSRCHIHRCVARRYVGRGARESRSLLLLLFEEVREHDRLQRHHHLVEEHQAEDLPADAPREARPQRRDPALLYYVLQAAEEEEEVRWRWRWRWRWWWWRR